jgi:hypothetical protein
MPKAGTPAAPLSTQMMITTTPPRLRSIKLAPIPHPLPPLHSHRRQALQAQLPLQPVLMPAQLLRQLCL